MRQTGIFTKEKNYYYSAKLKRIMFCIKNYNDNKIHHNLLLPFFFYILRAIVSLKMFVKKLKI